MLQSKMSTSQEKYHLFPPQKICKFVISQKSTIFFRKITNFRILDFFLVILITYLFRSNLKAISNIMLNSRKIMKTFTSTLNFETHLRRSLDHQLKVFTLRANIIFGEKFSPHTNATPKINRWKQNFGEGDFIAAPPRVI